jgi:hypothetical protein
LERFSYRHASPQVLDGEAPTVADDIYSLGSTLFTLLDGRAPFAGDDPDSDSALAYLRRVRSEPARRVRPAAPDGLLAIIARCLAKRPEDRYLDAASLRDDLTAVAIEVRAWAPGSTGSARRVQVAPVPARAERAQLARSAIEHLPPEPLDVPEPTAMRPREPAPPKRERPQLLRILALGGVALALGLAIGVAAIWAHGMASRNASPGGPTAAPVPTMTGPVPTGPTRVNDPTLAPQITALEDRGTAIELRWTDPSGGRALFVIVDVTGGEPRSLLQVVPGQTSVQVSGLRADADRYCFHVLALIGADTSAVSAPRCTGARG